MLPRWICRVRLNMDRDTLHFLVCVRLRDCICSGGARRHLRCIRWCRNMTLNFRPLQKPAEDGFAELEESGERAKMEERFILAAGGTLELKDVDLNSQGRTLGKQNTYLETLSLIKEGKSLQEIVTIRGLTFGTICDHLEKLLSFKTNLRRRIRSASSRDIPKSIFRRSEKHSRQLATSALHPYLSSSILPTHTTN